ncbi:MAG: DUF4149 domain-containing protein [Pyrinomonadaceae bacterium]
MWLGAALFFSAAVAPSAFAVLASSRELAGAIVARTLTVINISGFAVSLVLLLSAPLVHRAVKKSALFAEMCALALIAVATGVGQWVIRARLENLRAAMGRPVESLPANNPLRVAFG